MPVTNSEYEIAVKSTLDDNGLKKAQESLAAVGSQSDRAGDSLKETGRAHEEMSDKAQESGKKELDITEKTTLGHLEKREALRAVLSQFGGFADVGLLLEPELAALAASLAAVEALRSMIKETIAAQEALNTAIRELDAAKLNAAAAAASEFEAAMGAAANELDRFNQNYQTGTTAMDDRLKKYQEEKDAVFSVDEAKEKAFEAEINRFILTKQLTKEQGQPKIEAARLELDSERGAADQAKLKNTIEERAKALAEARVRVAGGADESNILNEQRNVSDTAKFLAQEQTEKDQLDKSPSDISDPGFRTKHFANLDSLQKAAQQAQQQMELTAATKNTSGTKEEADYIATAVAQQQKLVNLFNEEIQKRLKAGEVAQQNVDSAKRDHETAQSRLKTATDQSSKDQELITTAPDQIKSLQDQYDIQRQRNDQIHQAQQQAAQSRLGAEGASLPGTPPPPAPLNPADATAQAQWATTPRDGGQIGIDIVEGRRALAELQMRHRQGSEPPHEQLQSLLNEFVGLAQDLRSTNGERGALSQLIEQVKELRRESERHGQLLDQTSTVR